MKSFTFIETLIVFAILGVLLIVTLPLGIEFYHRQKLQSESEAILHNLRRAQFKAIIQERDSSFGVYFSRGFYTLFKGESYLKRDSNLDEIFKIPVFLKIEGPLEIVFSKLEGLPNFEGEIILKVGKYKRKILLNKEGRITLEAFIK